MQLFLGPVPDKIAALQTPAPRKVLVVAPTHRISIPAAKARSCFDYIWE
jgi:hypothetical protein